jgi:hypothetical protein
MLHAALLPAHHAVNCSPQQAGPDCEPALPPALPPPCPAASLLLLLLQLFPLHRGTLGHGHRALQRKPAPVEGLNGIEVIQVCAAAVLLLLLLRLW